MAKILLVDDDEEIRAVYGQILGELGHEVYVAKDAREARGVVRSEQDLDVALVDRILPGNEDGLDILRFLQSTCPLCRTIIVSGRPDFESASEAMRADACNYLAKPIKTERLREAVEEALEEKRYLESKAFQAEKSKKDYETLKTKQQMLQHDMRSLVIGIVGFSNLLIDRTSLDNVQLGYCKQIRECGLQLAGMVNTYLDIATLETESFKLNRSRFNLLDIIRQSRRTLHFLADEKNIAISIINNKRFLSIDDEIRFEGDRMYLQNAVDNLLKNAIEASPPDKRIKIKVKNKNRYVRVSIHNWGAVPEDIQARFFEKYATSGKKNGLGLGSYMAKLVVDAHGGRIGLNSSQSEGTEVFMELPAGFVNKTA